MVLKRRGPTGWDEVEVYYDSNGRRLKAYVGKYWVARPTTEEEHRSIMETANGDGVAKRIMARFLNEGDGAV